MLGPWGLENQRLLCLQSSVGEIGDGKLELAFFISCELAHSGGSPSGPPSNTHREGLQCGAVSKEQGNSGIQVSQVGGF